MMLTKLVSEKRYRRRFLFVVLLLFLTLGFLSNSETVSSEDITCPEKCIESQKNCEFSCSQIVGGGAKSRERRQCINSCKAEVEPCNERCLNPTPRPTLKPERYHDKSCANACEFKAKDCNEVCTKYMGGGAKSGKKAACRNECSEGLDNCKKWCVNPTPKPTLGPDPLETMPCPEACKLKKLNCDSNCSSFLGGGAKSEKRSKCMNECTDSNNECLSGCTSTE